MSDGRNLQPANCPESSREPTPTDPRGVTFGQIRGSPCKVNLETGEIWCKDKFHRDHWEVYKTKRDYEKGTRDRAFGTMDASGNDFKLDARSPKGGLANRLLSLQPGIRPEDVLAHYAERHCALRLKLLPVADGEGSPTIVAEGDRETLLFLADLLIAQASDPLDCGVGVSPEGVGSAVFDKSSEYGIYIHVLPCNNHPDQQADGSKTSEE